MPDPAFLKLPADKRARLFAASGAEFAANGFERASLNRIIGELGMSKSSFYHYFQNKTDLFQQTLTHALAPLMEALLAVDPQALTQETFWPEIAQLAQDMTRMAIEMPDHVTVARMFYRSFDNPGERALTLSVFANMQGWIEALILRGQGLGLIRTDLPRSYLFDMALALGMATDRWMLAHWDALDDQERLSLSDRFMGLFLKVLAPDGAA